MSYKNKTYVIFDADTDIREYNLMKAWKENDNIDFNFYNAHDLNVISSSSSEEQIKRKLKERLNNTKQAIVLVGKNTKNLYTFVRWEIEVALEMDIPIIAVYLCKSNETPPILKNKAYFLSVPFQSLEVKNALDMFPSEYDKNKSRAPSSINLCNL